MAEAPKTGVWPKLNFGEGACSVAATEGTLEWVIWGGEAGERTYMGGKNIL